MAIVVAALAYVWAKHSGSTVLFGILSGGIAVFLGGIAFLIAHPLSSLVLGRIGYSRFNGLALPGSSAEYAIFQLMITFVGIAGMCVLAGFAASHSVPPMRGRRR